MVERFEWGESGQLRIVLGESMHPLGRGDGRGRTRRSEEAAIKIVVRLTVWIGIQARAWAG